MVWFDDMNDNIVKLPKNKKRNKKEIQYTFAKLKFHVANL